MPVLLKIDDLHTHFATAAGVVRAVDGVHLEIEAGRTLAVVGESGSGKSLTALSVLRLVPPPGRVVRGRVLLEGTDLLTMSEPGLRAVRGRRIGMVFQEPMTSLNPLLTVGEQVVEPQRVHRVRSARAAREHAQSLLRRVGISDPRRRMSAYPHELSGGMRQRVMLAAALACDPALLIADEPTTALDVTVQAQILALLGELQRECGLALLFITHDFGVVAQLADTVAVMYAGRVVEHGAVADVLERPLHPYTRALLDCAARLHATSPDDRRQRLPVIAGDVPEGVRRPAGCAFHPRCPVGRSDPLCRSADPGLERRWPGRAVACWKAGATLPRAR